MFIAFRFWWLIWKIIIVIYFHDFKIFIILWRLRVLLNFIEFWIKCVHLLGLRTPFTKVLISLMLLSECSGLFMRTSHVSLFKTLSFKHWTSIYFWYLLDVILIGTRLWTLYIYESTLPWYMDLEHYAR